jgi:hypothetical protein
VETKNCSTSARKLPPLIGPSMTQGAVMRSWRSAGRKSLPRRRCSVSEDWRDGGRLRQAVCWLRERLMDRTGETK